MYENRNKKLEYFLLMFFDSTEPSPLYRRVFGFILIVSLIGLVLDIRFSTNANIVLLLAGGNPSVITYLVFVGLFISVIGLFAPKIYFLTRNFRPSKNKKEPDDKPTVPTALPTDWSWKNED